MVKRSHGWHAVRRQAFERDKKQNAPCAICGRPIDYSLGMSTRGGKDYNPDCWEGDHILPVDRWPELELDLCNVQPTHSGCNRSKKDRAGINLLGKPSRNWGEPLMPNLH